jgi:DnaJ-class molecular chaperone
MNQPTKIIVKDGMGRPTNPHPKWSPIVEQKEGEGSPLVTGTAEESKWQLCPKCNGTGQIINPYMGMTSPLTMLCDVCHGAKILATPTDQSTTIKDLLTRQDQLSETYDKMVAENERLTKALEYAQNKIYILEHTKNGVADHIRVDLMKLRDCVDEALNSIKK